MLYFCQPRAPHLTASLREQPAQTSVPPKPLFWCFRPAWMWCFRPAWNYTPGHAYWNQDPENSVTKNARLPRAPWDLVQFLMEGAQPMFAGPPLDYRRWTKIGLPPRPPESVPGCPGPWATPFCPFLAKTGGSRLEILSRFFFFQFLRTGGLYGSQYRRLIFWYYYVHRKKMGFLFYW